MLFRSQANRLMRLAVEVLVLPGPQASMIWACWVIEFASPDDQARRSTSGRLLVPAFPGTGYSAGLLLPLGTGRILDPPARISGRGSPSARKDDASPSRPFEPPGGLMEQSDASL